MREIRLSGSEGGGTGNSTGSPYPYPTTIDVSGAGHARDTIAKGPQNDWPCAGARQPSRNMIVPTLQRGSAARTLQRPVVVVAPPTTASTGRRGHGLLQQCIGGKFFAPTINHLLSAIVLERPIPSVFYGKVHNRPGPDGAWPRSTLQPSLPGL